MSAEGRAVAYVQRETIPPAPPPGTGAGPVAWLKENLFRGPVNSVLTLLSIGFLVWLIPQVIQWAFVDAVWFASSLEECRAINGEGACWAVIVERFDQPQSASSRLTQQSLGFGARKGVCSLMIHDSFSRRMV